MDKILGRVMTVAGSQTTVKLDADYAISGSLLDFADAWNTLVIAIPDGR